MARIFSIQFQHENNLQNALISVHETPLYTEFTISALSDSLKKLLPGDKVISSAPGQFNFFHSAARSNSLLMKEIIDAIAEHMHSLQH